MGKSFIDVVQNSPRTGLGIPVKTCPFAWDSHPRAHARLAGMLVTPTRGGIRRFLPRSTRTAKSA